MSDGGGSHESLWWSDLKIVCEGGRNINWFDEGGRRGRPMSVLEE